MTINFFNRKIPALLGLLIITIGLVFIIFLVESGTIFEIGAGPGEDPKNIQITNISDISFTLSYATDGKVIGTLKYGADQENLDIIVLDDRDQLSQSINKYKSHSITVKNLNPKTTYYFSITSGSKEFLNDGKPWEIQTGEVIEEAPTLQKPLSGRVITSSGQIPEEGLVFVTISGAGKLSNLLREDGTYVVPINNLRNESLNNSFKIENNMQINIEVISGNLSSSLTISPDQISPIPIITISSNNDFSSNESSSIKEQSADEEKILPTKNSVPNSEPSAPSPTLPPDNNSSVIMSAVISAISAVTGIFSSR